MNNKIPSQITAVIVIPLSFVFLFGCGFVQAKREADTVLARHFHHVSTNGFDTAMADYGPRFFENITKSEWTSTLEKISSEIGAYQSYIPENWRTIKNGDGTTVIINCKVIYSEKIISEKFRILKEANDDRFMIVGHHITRADLPKK